MPLVTIGRDGDIPPGGCIVIELAGKDVAIFNTDGKYYAIDDRCPHAGASLSGGCVEEGIITCPWHAWRFRLEDGTWADNPRIKIGNYPVHVIDGEIRIDPVSRK